LFIYYYAGEDQIYHQNHYNTVKHKQKELMKSSMLIFWE